MLHNAAMSFILEKMVVGRSIALQCGFMVAQARQQQESHHDPDHPGHLKRQKKTTDKMCYFFWSSGQHWH